VRGLGGDLAALVQQVGSLLDAPPVGGDAPRLDRSAGLGAALEEAALDQQDVGALAQA
jgi:hypothetical protein